MGSIEGPDDGSREGKMAATPRWKVYNADGEYIAATKHVEDAAALVALNGNGSTIRDGHSKKDIRWMEGTETFPAGESYDRVAISIFNRCEAIREWNEKKRAQNVARSGAEILGRPVDENL